MSSKLFNIYTLEKKNNDNILLFKSGIFYIALAEDATKLSNLFGFKLTNLNDSIKKCGFPCSSVDKYLSLFKAHNLEIKFIEPDKNISYDVKQFNQNQINNSLIDEIKNVDINSLSVSEIYSFVEKLKTMVEETNM